MIWVLGPLTGLGFREHKPIWGEKEKRTLCYHLDLSMPYCRGPNGGIYQTTLPKLLFFSLGGGGITGCSSPPSPYRV